MTHGFSSFLTWMVIRFFSVTRELSLGFLDRFLDEVIRLRDHDAHGVREQRADDAVVHEDGGLRRDAVRVQLSLDARQVVRLDRDEHEVEDAIAVRFVVADEGHARFGAHGVHERLERGDASGRGAPLQHHLARGARGLELARHVRPHAASPDHEHGRCGSHVVRGVAEAGTARRDARVTPAFGVTPPRLVRARRATGEFASQRSRPRAHPYDECCAERGGVSRKKKKDAIGRGDSTPSGCVGKRRRFREDSCKRAMRGDVLYGARCVMYCL
jgi:hypothetical protein